MGMIDRPPPKPSKSLFLLKVCLNLLGFIILIIFQNNAPTTEKMNGIRHRITSV